MVEAWAPAASRGQRSQACLGASLNPQAGRLPPAKVGPAAGAGVGAEVAVGILPSVGKEAPSTSYPEQNEL